MIRHLFSNDIWSGWSQLDFWFGIPIALAGNFLFLGIFWLNSRQRKLLREARKEIGSLKSNNTELAKLSLCDALTGLANRRAFDQAIGKEHARMLRNGSSLSLVYVDVDHFKKLNDSLGHQRGDACLRMIANELQRCIRRPADVAARIGGEEFAVLLPETDIAGAIEVAEAAKQAVERLCLDNPGSPSSPFVTISLGVATSSGTASDLINSADQALYAAKSAGRNRVFATMAKLIECTPVK